MISAQIDFTTPTSEEERLSRHFLRASADIGACAVRSCSPNQAFHFPGAEGVRCGRSRHTRAITPGPFHEATPASSRNALELALAVQVGPPGSTEKTCGCQDRMER